MLPYTPHVPSGLGRVYLVSPLSPSQTPGRVIVTRVRDSSNGQRNDVVFGVGGLGRRGESWVPRRVPRRGRRGVKEAPKRGSIGIKVT